MLVKNWHVKVMFTPCTANMAVDIMAALGRNVPLDLRIYDLIPDDQDGYSTRQFCCQI